MKTKTNNLDLTLIRSQFLKKNSSAEDKVYIFQKSPPFIEATLRDYQIEGLNWLIDMHKKSINCILADEMGLGKTLQTIAFLGYLKFVENTKKPSLVIVPKSILHNWRTEFQKFLPKLKTFVFHCTKEEAGDILSILKKSDADVFITTYEMCIKYRKYFSRNWCYIIIDEAHRIKNEESLLSKVVRLFNSEHRLLITGTPLQNNIKELWSLLNFLNPEIFPDAEAFEDAILETENSSQNTIINSHNNQKDDNPGIIESTEIKNNGSMISDRNNIHSKEKNLDKKSYDNQEKDVVTEKKANNLESLKKMLNFFFLRREKSTVEHSIPPKKLINLYVRMSTMQRAWYKGILEKNIEPLIGQSNRSTLLNILIRLRQCCNHPYLFEGAEPGPPYTTGEHLVNSSGKLLVLDRLLKRLKSQDSRVLIFSQMTTMLDILEDYCEMRKFVYRRIDGSTPGDERIEAIDDFNRENSDVFIFLLSTRSGGLGINLATANTVILYDSDWNPQMDLQAQDRAHRIGQKKQVTVYRLLIENSIEERILYQGLRKLKLDEMLVRQNTSAKSLSDKELLGVIAAGVDKLDQVGEIDIDIDEIIKAGEEKTRLLTAQIDEIKLSEKDVDKGIYEWEGEDYRLRQQLHEKFGKSDSGLSKRKKTFIRPTSVKIPEFPIYQFYPPMLKKLIVKELQDGLDDQEKQLKESLEVEAFPDWNKKDFHNFIKAMELYGRNNFMQISEFIGKPVEAVQKYHKTFWARIEEIPTAEKIQWQIARGEKKLEEKMAMVKLIDDFEAERKNSGRILYTTKNTRSRFFSEDVDMLILNVYKHHIHDPGYAEIIRKAVCNSEHALFDFYLQGLTAQEVNKRLNTLLGCLNRYRDYQAYNSKERSQDNRAISMNK